MQKKLMLLIFILIATSWLVGCGGDRSSSVPRNRTLIMDCSNFQACSGQILDYNAFNPFLLTGTTKTGWNFLYEPLYFYNAYSEKDNMIPWIATGHEYSDDYTELTIRIRPGVEWSDGQPWTAHDLVFTIDMLRNNAPQLTFSTDMANWVASAVAVDSLTARIELTAPIHVFSSPTSPTTSAMACPSFPSTSGRGEIPRRSPTSIWIRAGRW